MMIKSIFVCSTIIWLTATSAAAVTFDIPIHLDPPINTTYVDRGPSESSDALTLYFSSDRPGGQGSASLWQATRATSNDPFGNPTNIAVTNSSYQDFAPTISCDGLSLMFISNRPGVGSGDTWQTTRASLGDPFGAPSIVPNINSTADEGATSLSPDGLTLYLFSARSGGQGSYDLYQATRPTINDDFGTPASLGATVNSAFEDIGPSVTSDGLTMYFMSSRPAGLGAKSIWQSSRPSISDPFGAATLVPNVNAVAFDGAPKISADGTRLYLQSDRPGSLGGRDIYVASAVEDPSNASFSTGADLDVLNIDFGVVEVGSSVSSIGFDVANLLSAGPTASLQFDGSSSSGNTSKLTTDFSLASAIQAGSSESFQSFIDTSSSGSFAASYELDFTDVFGTDQTLTLNLSGLVLPADDPSIPDLIYNAATGEVILDPDASSIIGYVLKNTSGGFLAGGHTPILGGVATSLPSEISEASFSGPAIPTSIGNVFPAGMDIAQLYGFLSLNEVSRSFGSPIVPFDLIVIGDTPAVPEPSTYAMAAIGLVALGFIARRRQHV